MDLTPAGRTPRGAIGGASGDAGVEYRRAVAAYTIAHGLAGAPLLGFGVPPVEAAVAAVSLETDDPVDDIAVEFESGWRATVQARRSLRKRKPIDSAIAQWRHAAEEGIDLDRERLVLITGSMSNSISTLKRVLDRLKTERPGELTAAERQEFEYLESRLMELSSSQRESVVKSASIHLLHLEEEDVQHSREAVRLLDDVVGRQSSERAWRDLVRLAGRTARRRGGFTLAGWLNLLTQEGHQVSSEGSTRAAELQRVQSALDRYKGLVKGWGEQMDLRSLGATLAPLPVSAMDARIRVFIPGGDERDRHDLLWAFLRRGRMLLTGLPGGGKSMSLAMTAARLFEVPDAALPVVASLRDIDRHDRSASFRDRLLDVAVRDLPGSDRTLVRDELDRRLQHCGIALLLDSLDETYGRRGNIVQELDNFLKAVSDDVDVLVATRDVAYGQALTLGWPEMRLSSPEDVDRPVQAVLEATAAFGGETDADDWIRTRVDWVNAVLARDPSLRETPLLPILLALLAAEKGRDALPEHRAGILHAIVKNVVQRREARREDEFRVGELVGEMAASASLDGFEAEAAEIAINGGQCTVKAACRAVANMLADRWDLRAGRGEVTAEAIVRFWDEAGIFVASGAEEIIAPRVQLFAEVGEALNATKRSDDEVARWVDAAVHDSRLESLVLAAGLSPVAARQLLLLAATAEDHNLLLAATTAVREGAPVGEPELRRLIEAVLHDARVGDREG